MLSQRILTTSVHVYDGFEWVKSRKMNRCPTPVQIREATQFTIACMHCLSVVSPHGGAAWWSVDGSQKPVDQIGRQATTMTNGRRKICILKSFDDALPSRRLCAAVAAPDTTLSVATLSLLLAAWVLIFSGGGSLFCLLFSFPFFYHD